MANSLAGRLSLTIALGAAIGYDRVYIAVRQKTTKMPLIVE
jgi:hypothetical protein